MNIVFLFRVILMVQYITSVLSISSKMITKMVIPLRITNLNPQTGITKNNSYSYIVIATTKRCTFGRRRTWFASEHGSYSSRSIFGTQQRMTSSLLFANLMNQNDSSSRGGSRKLGFLSMQPFFRPRMSTTIGTHHHQLYSSSTSKRNENDNNVKGESTSTRTNTTTSTSQFMQELKGVSKSYDTSSTEFITHFVANENNTFTMESAIQSVLTRAVPLRRKHNHQLCHNMFVFDKVGTKQGCGDDEYLNYDQDKNIDMNSWTGLLVDYETKNPIVQSLDAKFRYDPDFLGYDDDESDQDQLSPAELIALGSVWYLPHDAPRDPSLGGKVSRCRIGDFECSYSL